jgi:uncharacterized membrane protein
VGVPGGDDRPRADARAGTADRAERPEVTASADRILTLTDGVVAIAMTLLVLDLNTISYKGGSASTLWRSLNQAGDQFIAFVIAFWVIAQFWLSHHRVFRGITRYDESIARRNCWFLFGISLLPFSARLLGQTSSNNPLPVTLFSANLLLVTLALTWTSHGAGGQQRPEGERQLLLRRARTVTAATLFVLPGVLAWVIPPGTAELLFALQFLADVPGHLIVLRRQHLAARHHHTHPAKQ